MNKSSIVELLKSHSLCKSRSLFLEKEIYINKQSVSAGKEIEPESIIKLELELSQLKHKIDTVETCLKMVGEFSERYKIILELHFFSNVRMEDIADTTHMSRSRCYELCNEAVDYMSRIIFGEDQRQDAV